jgi:hypothetical protein
MTTKQAIEQALRGQRKPMRVPAIIEAAVPLTALAGRTSSPTSASSTTRSSSPLERFETGEACNPVPDRCRTRGEKPPVCSTSGSCRGHRV